jgi:hypothetical protein
MFGGGKSYFANSPVLIDISGLEWPESSPFNIVRIEVLYGGKVVGDFKVDTGGQTSTSFDISSALRNIWSDYDFADNEIAKAQAALTAIGVQEQSRSMREYSLQVYTEYMSSDGEFTTTDCGEFAGGRCMIGGLTEWERSLTGAKENADASHWEHTNRRNGDASTKPRETPERVGRSSITSWTDISNSGTRCAFYPKGAAGGEGTADTTEMHAPLVLRDSQDYVDFLFVNRRGAIETCSGMTLEDLKIAVKTKQYSKVERPAFKPTRSLIARASGGRRSFSMSSGMQTREWAEWWTLEFLMARQWWMLYKGPGQDAPAYTPVIVEPAKSDITIYDRTKQQVPHVDFTVTMALEG